MIYFFTPPGARAGDDEKCGQVQGRKQAHQTVLGLGSGLCPNIYEGYVLILTDRHFRISHLKTLAALLPMLWCDRRPGLESLGEGWSNTPTLELRDESESGRTCGKANTGFMKISFFLHQSHIHVVQDMVIGLI